MARHVFCERSPDPLPSGGFPHHLAIRVRLPEGKKSAQCPRCKRRVTVPRPTKALWRATTHAERVRNRERAERMLEQKLTELKRLATSVSLWQRRVKYYTREVERTDEERAAHREQQAAAREERRRRAAGRRVVL